MQGYKVWVLALALFLIGGGLFLYKWRGLGYPLLPEEETRIWTVETTVQFDAGERAMPVKATLHIPGLTPGFAILDENFVSRGFGFTTRLRRRRPAGAVGDPPGQGPADALLPGGRLQGSGRRPRTTPRRRFPTVPVLGEPLDTALQELVAQVREPVGRPGVLHRGAAEAAGGFRRRPERGAAARRARPTRRRARGPPSPCWRPRRFPRG